MTRPTTDLPHATGASAAHVEKGPGVDQIQTPFGRLPQQPIKVYEADIFLPSMHGRLHYYPHRICELQCFFGIRQTEKWLPLFCLTEFA